MSGCGKYSPFVNNRSQIEKSTLPNKGIKTVTLRIGKVKGWKSLFLKSWVYKATCQLLLLPRISSIANHLCHNLNSPQILELITLRDLKGLA